MVITGPQIRVTQDTTATQILSFVHANKDPNAKLVAEKKDGGTVLYFKSAERSNPFERMFGIASKRRELAADTLKQVIGRVETSLNQKIDNKEQSKIMFDNFRAIADGKVNRSMHGDVAKLLFKTLSSLELASNVMQTDVKPETPKKMEDALPKSMMAKRGDQSFDIKTSGGKVIKLPDFELNGKTYVPVHNAGFGATADIIIYKNAKDDNDKVAVKVPNANQDEEGLQKFEEEGILHAKITTETNKHSNILQMKGGLRLADDGPAVIMDLAPNGDLFKLGRALRRLEGEGVGEVPPELHKIVSASILKETAAGMEALHKAGYTHNDAKDVNVMLNSKGRPVLIDFGETKPLGKTRAAELMNDNAAYASPELFYHKFGDQQSMDKLKKLDKDFNAMTKQMLNKQGLGEKIVDLLEEINGSFKTSLTEMKYKFVAEERGNFDPTGNDNWALGTIALTLFTGKQIGDGDKHKYEAEDRLKNYVDGEALKNDDTTLSGVANDALGSRTDDENINELIEKQFSKDPNERLGGGMLKDHAALKLPGVGLDSVFEFATVAQKLGTLDDDLEYTQNKLQELLLDLQKRNANDYEVTLLKDYRESIEDMKNRRPALLEEFEKTKTIALIDIEIQKVDELVKSI